MTRARTRMAYQVFVFLLLLAFVRNTLLTSKLLRNGILTGFAAPGPRLLTRQQWLSAASSMDPVSRMKNSLPRNVLRLRADALHQHEPEMEEKQSALEDAAMKNHFSARNHHKSKIEAHFVIGTSVEVFGTKINEQQEHGAAAEYSHVVRVTKQGRRSSWGRLFRHNEAGIPTNAKLTGSKTPPVQFQPRDGAVDRDIYFSVIDVYTTSIFFFLAVVMLVFLAAMVISEFRVKSEHYLCPVDNIGRLNQHGSHAEQLEPPSPRKILG